MLKYKVDLMELLKAAGYSSARIRREKILGQSVLTKIRAGRMLSPAEMNTICNLLHTQPGDLICHVADDGNDYSSFTYYNMTNEILQAWRVGMKVLGNIAHKKYGVKPWEFIDALKNSAISVGVIIKVADMPVDQQHYLADYILKHKKER